MSTPTSFWKFNPRFYRGTRSNVVFCELYWILSFEFLAMASLLAAILFFAIPESTRAKERRDHEIERRRLEKLQVAPPASSASDSSDTRSGSDTPSDRKEKSKE